MGDNWELHHLGLVIRDVDKAFEYYQSLGIGTVGPEGVFDSNKIPGFQVFGKPEHHLARMRMVNIGSVFLELMQPLEGRYPHAEFLNKYGEGIYHIGLVVDGLEEVVAELEKKGAPVILGGNFPDGNLAFVYVDTSKVGNIILELMQPPVPMKTEVQGNDWELHHVGVVVRDVDKASEYFESLGIARIEPEFMFDTNSIPDFKVHGKPERHKARVKMVHIGSLPLELLQPLEGHYPHAEFLDRRGEGISHIGILVDDLEKKVAELVENGGQVVLSGNNPDGALSFVYVDTTKVGDTIIELMQRPKE